MFRVVSDFINMLNDCISDITFRVVQTDCISIHQYGSILKKYRAGVDIVDKHSDLHTIFKEPPENGGEGDQGILRHGICRDRPTSGFLVSSFFQKTKIYEFPE